MNFFENYIFSDKVQINTNRIVICNKLFNMLTNYQQDIIKDMDKNDYIPENILNEIFKNDFFKENESNLLKLSIKNNYIFCILIMFHFLHKNFDNLLNLDINDLNLNDYIKD